MNEKAGQGDAGPFLPPHPSSLLLSRRDLLGHAGRGASGLAALALLSLWGDPASAARPRTRLERLLPGAREVTPLGGRGLLPRAAAAASTDILQLPFWGDANWVRPEYYTTIQSGPRAWNRTVQSADVDGDGQDELLARGPQGMLVHRFDPDSGQWFHLPANGTAPPWSDVEGFDQPQYFYTMQCADFFLPGDPGYTGDGAHKQAVLMVRDSGGIELWRYDVNQQKWIELPGADTGPAWSDLFSWDEPERYFTIRLGDIDGDGRAELLGKNPEGIEVWKYDIAAQKWTALPDGPHWPDTNGPDGWNRYGHFMTIRLADINGDGRAELLGRGVGGVEAWRFDGQKWTQLPSGPRWPEWADGEGWLNDASHYSTIQCADLVLPGDPKYTGDGTHPQAAVLGRLGGGVEVWTYGNNQWVQLGTVPGMTDGLGWESEQYYATIQCADIDGDDRAELLGRDSTGIQAWKYDPTSNGWSQMKPAGPAWSDTASTTWSAAEHYWTIQTARVKGSAINANNPPIGLLFPGGKPVAALIGRARLSVETWRFVADSDGAGTPAWLRTSAPWPAFPDGTPRGDAYAYITHEIPLDNTGTHGIRAKYDDANASLFPAWINQLLNEPPNAIPPPPPASIPTADWLAVRDQIIQELTWLGFVHDWYGVNFNDLITTSYQGKDVTMKAIGAFFDLADTDNSSVFLNILTILFQGAAAILGFPELEAGNAAAIAGVLSTAFSGATDFGLPGGDDGFKAAYADLVIKLGDDFNAALAANAANQLAITGGTPDKDFVPGDYGLLAAIGQQIHSTAWDWPETLTPKLAVPIERQYAISLWQALIGLKWQVEFASLYGPDPRYPSQYIYSTGNQPKDKFWMALQTTTEQWPATPTLSLLFDPAVSGVWHPLGASKADAFDGKNGWPVLDHIDNDPSLSRPPSRPKRPTLGADLQISGLALSRDASTGVLVAKFTVSNRGLGAATNVTLTRARLGNREATDGVPWWQTHLAAGRSQQMKVVFPGSIGVPGERAVLRLSGRYVGGTFGASLRVQLP